jgi:hypothetical protein
MTPSPEISARILAMLNGDGCTTGWLKEQLGCRTLGDARAYALGLGAVLGGAHGRWMFQNRKRKQFGEDLLNSPVSQACNGRPSLV